MQCRLLLISTLLLALSAQEAKEGAVGDARKTVTIKRILIEGTRLPPLSVIKLAQIKAGDEVNFLKLNAAMQKVTQTGLIGKIDFEYESVPDGGTDVILHMLCADVNPSAKASIQIPNVNEDDVWTWLAAIDPLFTRDMPPNEAAIRLYSHWIGKYLETHGQPNFMENAAVIADGSNSSGGTAVDRLVFKVRKRRGLK